MKMLRKKFGLRQIDVATRLGVSQSYISQLENLRAIDTLTLKRLKELAKVYHLTAIELLEVILEEESKLNK